MRCHDHEPLSPVFGGLTPSRRADARGVDGGARRAGARRGYRFEDEALVDEMVDSVEGARAALPLLAFAVSRLWERRDRGKKAAARAKPTGRSAASKERWPSTPRRRWSASAPEREAIVREIFRNLDDGPGHARGPRPRGAALGVSRPRRGGTRCCERLVDARLLTTYETDGSRGRAEPDTGWRSCTSRCSRPGRGWCGGRRRTRTGRSFGTSSGRRRTCGRSGAAAEDLLWTGASYPRLPGLARALPGRAHRRSRRTSPEPWRRSRTGSGADGASPSPRSSRRWRSASASWPSSGAASETARRKADAQARRAEASKLLALGAARARERIPPAPSPTPEEPRALRHPDARLFALRVLQEAPTATRTPDTDSETSDGFTNHDARLQPERGMAGDRRSTRESSFAIGTVESP